MGSRCNTLEETRISRSTQEFASALSRHRLAKHARRIQARASGPDFDDLERLLRRGLSSLAPCELILILSERWGVVEFTAFAARGQPLLRHTVDLAGQ